MSNYGISILKNDEVADKSVKIRLNSLKKTDVVK